MTHVTAYSEILVKTMNKLDQGHTSCQRLNASLLIDVKGVMHSEHTKIMRGGTGECGVTVVYIPQDQKEGYCRESACIMLNWTTELISLKVASWIV